MFIKNLFKIFNRGLIKYFKPYFFSFVDGHYYLTQDNLQYLRSFVGKKSEKFINDFENDFANLIGEGKCFSYASARMGFYEIMKALNIGKGDEVILLGFTCSVMANAVLKRKAIPIYSDIDKNTYGSCEESIRNCISEKTRMIIAQHSFGIPCDILGIKKLAQKHKIFLLEDCALTFGSKISNVIVGNYGDAAIFSTDHTKPINTMTGGIIYTKKDYLIKKLKFSKKLIPEISYKKQLSLFNQIKIERYFCNPNNNGKFYLFNLFMFINKKFFNYEEPFLCDEFSSEIKSSYPYPANIPTFLAILGQMEISRWEKVKSQRIYNLKKFIKCTEDLNISLPQAYKNEDLQIVPLRFAFEIKDSYLIKKNLSKIIDTNCFWFRKPLIGSKEPLENFYYKKHSCPKSELLGKRIINIPCTLDENNANKFCSILEEFYTNNLNL